MSQIAFLIFGILSATAIIHVLWGLGITWPLRDTQALINTVVGAKGMTRMPGMGLTLVVAAGMAAAAVFALWGAGVVALPLPIWMRTASLGVLAAIFLLRGMATYLPLGPLANSIEPFRSLDKRFYAPLILALGLGYLALLGSVLRAL